MFIISLMMSNSFQVFFYRLGRQAGKQAGSLLKENDNNFMNRGCLLLVSSLFYSTGRAQEQYTFWVSVTLVEDFEGAEMIKCGPSMMDQLASRRVVFLSN